MHLEDQILETGFVTFSEVTSCILSVFETFDTLSHKAVSNVPIKQSDEPDIFKKQHSPDEDVNSWLVYIVVTYWH